MDRERPRQRKGAEGESNFFFRFALSLEKLDSNSKATRKKNVCVCTYVLFLIFLGLLIQCLPMLANTNVSSFRGSSTFRF